MTLTRLDNWSTALATALLPITAVLSALMTVYPR